MIWKENEYSNTLTQSSSRVIAYFDDSLIVNGQLQIQLTTFIDQS